VVAMLNARVTFVALVTFALASCAGGSYQVVWLPQRDADLYPLAQKQAGITIAIDEIKSPARAERYFGADLIDNGIVPVAVIISNYGGHRVNVKPSDVLVSRGKEVIDPLPLELVVRTAKRAHGFVGRKAEEQIDAFFKNVAFSETLLFPNDTYQGVMFFPAPKPEKTSGQFFTALSLWREAGPKVLVGATDLDTRERLHFGPFSVVLGENAGLLREISY